MQFDRRPFFMSDESWYEEIDLMGSDDPECDRGYILTDAAPLEARESYDAYYEMLEADDPRTLNMPELQAKAFRLGEKA